MTTPPTDPPRAPHESDEDYALRVKVDRIAKQRNPPQPRGRSRYVGKDGKKIVGTPPGAQKSPVNSCAGSARGGA